MTPPHPRYLIGFDSRHCPVEETDVLVIGCGVAGLSTAIEAAQSGCRVLAVAKAELDLSNTRVAQGGIAAETEASPASLEEHTRDTLAAGDGLCDESVVRTVIAAAADAIRFLEDCGCRFDQDPTGARAIGREAAHSSPRIIHAGGDATGAEIMRGLLSAAQRLPTVRSYAHTFTIDLLTEDVPSGKRCIGAVIHRKGETCIVFAGATVLATGGCGKLYRESSNSAVAGGDGHAMALRAGAVLRDLEMVQFHPTVFYVAGAPRVLVTEAIRGAGAYLRNAAGERFMARYDERGELAPRDVVARAISEEMRRSGEAAVFLDVTHLGVAMLRGRFPNFAALCERYDIDLSHSWVPVRPAPHYMMGGVATDIDGCASVEGLYAVGEVACSGLHGANRLASNSLLEGVVLGRRVGQWLGRARPTPRVPPFVSVTNGKRDPSVDFDFADLSLSFRALMGRCLGVEREERGIHELIRRLDHWQRLLTDMELTRPEHWTLMNGVQLGRAMAESALFRKESRGAHFRRDFPKTDASLAGKHVEYVIGKAPVYSA